MDRELILLEMPPTLIDRHQQMHKGRSACTLSEYSLGNIPVAPAKDPNDENVLFDSVVDNIANPSIFVVFYDADAYPEYLITYK